MAQSITEKKKAICVIELPSNLHRNKRVDNTSFVACLLLSLNEGGHKRQMMKESGKKEAERVDSNNVLKTRSIYADQKWSFNLNNGKTRKIIGKIQLQSILTTNRVLRYQTDKSVELLMHTWPIRKFGKQTDVAISMLIELASLIGHALDLAIVLSERFISFAFHLFSPVSPCVS